MNNLLKFLDFASIDSQMYWRIPGQDPQASFEIQWRREGLVRWRFRPYGDVLWNLGDDENLMSQFEKHGIDTEIFSRQLKSSLLHQVCYADRIVSDARVLIGSEEIDTALREHRDFVNSIEEAVAELLKPDGANEPGSSPRLRLIKD